MIPFARTPAAAIEKAKRIIPKNRCASPTKANPPASSGWVGMSCRLRLFMRDRNCAHKNRSQTQRRVRNCNRGTQKSTNHQPDQVSDMPAGVLNAYQVEM